MGPFKNEIESICAKILCTPNCHVVLSVWPKEPIKELEPEGHLPYADAHPFHHVDHLQPADSLQLHHLSAKLLISLDSEVLQVVLVWDPHSR